MDDGRIVAEGSPAALIAQHAARDVVELRFAADADRLRAAGMLERAGRVEPAGDRLLIYTDAADLVLKLVHDEALTTTSVLSRRGSLEDVFLILTGRSLED